jgi:hypothetical protein
MQRKKLILMWCNKPWSVMRHHVVCSRVLNTKLLLVKNCMTVCYYMQTVCMHILGAEMLCLSYKLKFMKLL